MRTHKQLFLSGYKSPTSNVPTAFSVRTSKYYKMKSLLISIMLLSLGYWSFGQDKNYNEWSVSFPSIWNKSEVTNLIGPSRQIEGSAWSYGVNTSYSRTILKGLFAKAGLGYFKQNFGIKRPFDYSSPTQPLFTTSSYNYQSWYFILGMGYKIELEKKINLKSSITYNIYQSFKQTYKPQTQNQAQVNKDNFLFGRSIIISAGLVQKINRRFSLGADLQLPVYTKWRKDEIFRENANENYSPKSIMGLTISGNYNF